MARTATQAVEVGPAQVAAGERVAMLYGAANHDPALFVDPHALDVGRANANRHIAFGYGIHHCLGSRLAMLQLSLILEALLRRFPRYEVVSDPAYIRSNFVLAMKRLDISLSPAGR
jgi:cytochrome P450